MTQTESQKKQIMNALMTGAKLTVMDAINYFGCYALSQRCGELRREGFPIKREMITVPQSRKRIAQYSL